MTRTTRRLAGAALALTLAGCGGGGSNTTPTTLPPTTTVPPCTQTVLFSFSGSIDAGDGGLVSPTPTTTQVGRLDILVDWTFADSQIAVWVTPANSCRTQAQFDAGCNFLIRSDDGPKPRKVSAHNVPASAYDVLVINASNRREATSIQGFLRSETCPAFSAVPSVDVETNQQFPANVR